VLSLIAENAYQDTQAKQIIALAKKGFAHPRKQLKQTLAQSGGGDKELIANILTKHGLSPLARPEELPLTVWAVLVEAIQRQSSL